MRLLFASTVVLAGIACCASRSGRALADPLADMPAPARAQSAAEPPRRRRPRRRLVLLAALVGALTTGLAIAAWTVAGSGSGYAKASTASALTLGDASASTTADLFPGATGTVKLTVTNSNAFPVRITTVTGNGTITSDKGAACNASTGVAFANQSGLTLDVAAGATATLTLAGAVSMGNASDNACQGAVFTIPVTVSGISNA